MIDKLEYLIGLARERHFGRAAIACGVTQPTLSSGIRQLEETLGVLLVHRGSRFHGLTEEGERTLGWARRIVADARAMRDDLRGGSLGLAGTLRLAAIPSALPAVAGLTTPFRARHPRVGFTVLAKTSAEILAMLDDLQIDAGLSYVDQEKPERVRTMPLYSERYCLVIAADEAGGFGPTVSWAEVSQVPLCLLTPDMQNRRIIEQRLQRGRGWTRPPLESNSMIVLLTHIGMGAWASVLSERMAHTFVLPEHLRIIPVEDPAPPMIGLIYPERDPVAALTAALLATARDAGMFAEPHS